MNERPDLHPGSEFGRGGHHEHGYECAHDGALIVGVFALGDYTVQSGHVVSNASIVWRTHGVLSAKKDNVITGEQSSMVRKCARGDQRPTDAGQ